MFRELGSLTAIEEMEPTEFLTFLEQEALAWGSKHRRGSYYAGLFLCSRWTMARRIVETGVGYGFSSYTLLASSDLVKLTSIDFPNKEYYEPTKYGATKDGTIETGMIVPRELRDRWELIIGDAKTELPRVFMRLPEVDIFLHDSDHTREHMMFEFETALPRIRNEGMLLSDDVELNSAFTDFCKMHNLHFVILGGDLDKSEAGVAVKS